MVQVHAHVKWKPVTNFLVSNGSSTQQAATRALYQGRTHMKPAHQSITEPGCAIGPQAVEHVSSWLNTLPALSPYYTRVPGTTRNMHPRAQTATMRRLGYLPSQPRSDKARRSSKKSGILASDDACVAGERRKGNGDVADGRLARTGRKERRVFLGYNLVANPDF
ncbi:hypothetical protein BKA81DRAFT_193409 [Phyllosticta paracitricarpa]